MTAATASMPKPKPRWFHLTPGRLLVVLLVVEAVLLLSERFKWFPFNEYKGWTVLIALATVGVFLLFMLIWFVFALLFRRRFQFSIRSLLVLTIAVALPFSWLAVELKWARTQRETVEALMKLGGILHYDKKFYPSAYPPALLWMRVRLGDDFFCNVACVSFDKVTDIGLEHLKDFTQLQQLFLNNTKVTDAGLEHLKGLTQLNRLDLSNTAVTDIGLEHLKGLVQLQWLELSSTTVTDAGLEHLKDLTQIQQLYLDGTNVTDVGVEHLKGLTKLRSLLLDNTKVSDVGMEHLIGLTQLQTLYLDGTNVTDVGVENLKGLAKLHELCLDNTKVSDEGMKHLINMTQLQRLFLSNTKVTDAGVAKLQKALPNLKIEQY
jgi:hypothetical protein